MPASRPPYRAFPKLTWAGAVVLLAFSLGGCDGCGRASQQASADRAADSSAQAPIVTGFSNALGQDPGAFTFAPEPPPRYRVEGLRIATLNTEFLFDGAGNEGQARFAWQGDPQAARAHRDRIGAVIRMLDADVVMLQEVEDQETVDQLIGESLAGLGYTSHFVQGTDHFTGQDVALLSRLPVEETGRSDERAPVGASGSDYGVSKHMYARMRLAGQPATLIGVHLLARPDDPGRKDKREAQAEVIRRLAARELQAGRGVIVLGDFNDFEAAAPDLAGSEPITGVLARIKAAGPGPDDDLRNLMAAVPQVERYTAFYDRNRDGVVDGAAELSALDHVLVSPALYRLVREVNYVQAHDPAEVTDHFPIVVTLARN